MIHKAKTIKPICLMILDGWGLSAQIEGNAIRLAKTPNMDNYYKIYPNTRLDASGEAVGLPEGQMGNSEVGHLNIGAGRVVYQELTRINKEIKNGTFLKNKVLTEAIENVKKNNTSLHLMGLVSDGGVHSHIEHLKALINLVNNNKIENLFIHAFLDGRDVPPRSAIKYLKGMDYYLKEKGIGEISSVSGRYYSMDRDNRWDRTKKSYDALVYRIGEKFKRIFSCNNVYLSCVRRITKFINCGEFEFITSIILHVVLKMRFSNIRRISESDKCGIFSRSIFK